MDLREFKNIESQKQLLADRITKLRAAAEVVTPSYGEHVGHNTARLKDDIYADLVDLEEQYAKFELDTRSKLQIIKQQLLTKDEMDLLVYRYELGYTWTKVALRMNRSRSTCFDINRRLREKVKDIEVNLTRYPDVN